MSLTTHTKTLFHILVFLLIFVNMNPWVVLAVDPDSRSSENSGRSGSSVGNAGSSGASTAGNTSGSNNGGSDQSPTAVGPGAGGEPDADIDGTPDSAENDQAASAAASISASAGKSGLSATASTDGKGTVTVATKDGKTHSFDVSNQAELGKVQDAVKDIANAAGKNMTVGKDINFEKSIECGCVVGAKSGAKSTDVGRDRQAIGVDGVAAKEIEVATAKGAVDATLSGYFGAKNAPTDGSVALGTGGTAANTTSISSSLVSGWNYSSKIAVTVVPDKYFDGKYGEYTENATVDIKNNDVLSEKETTVKEKMEQAKEDLSSYLDVPDQYSVAPTITNLEGVVNIGQTISDALAKNPDAVSDRIVDAYAKHADTVSYNAALTHADNQIEAKSNEIDAFTNSQFSYTLANPTDESALYRVEVLVDTSRSYTEAATFARESQAYNASIQGTNIVSETISALGTIAGKSRMAENEAYYSVIRQAYENKVAPTEKTAQVLEEKSLKYNAISSLSGKIGRTYSEAKTAAENNDELGVVAAAKTATQAMSMISIVDNPVASFRAISDEVTSRNLKTATDAYENYTTKVAIDAITNPSTFGIQTEGIGALNEQFKDAYAKNGLEGVTEKASELNALARAENPGSFINISPTVTTNTTGKSELSINVEFGVNYAGRSNVTSGSIGLGQIDSNDEASVIDTPQTNDTSKNLEQSQDTSLASYVVEGVNNIVSSLVSLTKSFFE